MALFTAKGSSGQGFQRLPEGKQVLLVKAVEFDPTFFTDTVAQVVVILATRDGITHQEKFNVATDGGSKAFTFMIKTIHNRFDIKEGDSLDELVETAAGNYIEADVEWQEAVNKDGAPITTAKGEPLVNVRLNNKKHSTGWEELSSANDVEVVLDEQDSGGAFTF